MLSEYGFPSTINKYTRLPFKTCRDHAFVKVRNRNLKEICKTYVLDNARKKISGNNLSYCDIISENNQTSILF